MNFSKDLIGKNVKWLRKKGNEYHGPNDFYRGPVSELIPKGKSGFKVIRKFGFTPKSKAVDIATRNDRVFVICEGIYYTPIVGAIVEERG